MIFYPNAKINLGLNIVSARTDGFHNIETIMYPVNLVDIVEFAPNNKTILKTTGINIKSNLQNNLIYKAYTLLQEKYSLPELKIHLHKIIPIEAGLGGGSADASFMLKALNEYFKLKIAKADLLEYAEQIGSDCPFFIENKPVFASSKGEVLEKIKLNLEGYFLTIIKPKISINTAEAYKSINPKKSKTPLNKLIKLPINEWKNNIFNDFEEYAFAKHPELLKIKTELYKLGAEFALLTGSGSAVYGIFKSPQEIDTQHISFNINM